MCVCVRVCVCREYLSDLSMWRVPKIVCVCARACVCVCACMYVYREYLSDLSMWRVPKSVSHPATSAPNVFAYDYDEVCMFLCVCV